MANRTRGTHRCRAVVDLDAFTRNVRSIGERILPKGMMLVLKADAYGHGAVSLARLAATQSSVTGICVVSQGEGIELREAGIELPILILSRVPDPPRARLYDLAVSVSSLTDVEALAIAGGKGLRVHVEVDTGMHRMGAGPSQVPSMIRALARGGMHLAGIYTHFACADEIDRKRTLEQLEVFERLAETLPPSVIRHAANSAAALHDHPDAVLDAARIGGAVFGLWTGGAEWVKDITEPIMSVRATVASLVDVPPGEGVGYGLLDSADRRRQVATIAIGYADGFPRALGSGAPVLAGGRITATIGRVSMDWTAIDASGLDLSIGDEVTIIGTGAGKTITAEDLAETAGTVSYEITCSLGSRLSRIYVGGAEGQSEGGK